MNLDVERSILGGVILDNSLYAQAAQLTQDDFSLEAHRLIWARISGLCEQQYPADMVTLAESLNQHKEIERIGGIAYLSSLIDGVPERPSIEHYVRIVRNKALLRGLITVAQRITSEAMDSSADADEVLNRAGDTILQISENRIVKKPLIKLAELTLAAREAMFHQEEAGLTTSIPGLDKHTDGGIRPEELWIIGGDPGSGKSALASQIAAENGRKGRRVALFSIEMKTQRIMRRLWCYESGLFYSKLKRSPNALPVEDRKEFDIAVDAVLGWPIWINDAANLSPQEFVAQARLAVLRDRVELCIVDHVQIMAENTHGRDDIDKIKTIAGAFRQFAKDYCPVIALSQLSRQSSEQRGKRPTMQDLYGSRFLEANASVILMTWHPKDSEGNETHEDEIIIAKNREGEVTNVPVLFRGALMRFQDREVRR